MELVFYAVAFYAWQCLAYVPASGTGWIFVAPIGWLRVFGSGWRMHSPWPGARGWMSSGFDFEFTPVGLCRYEASVSFPALSRVAVRGARVVVDGAVLLRATSAAEARALASLFARLAATPEAERARAIDEIVARAFSAEACRASRAEARKATRLLRWACDAEFVLVFGVAAALALSIGGENAWLALLPPLGVAHALALVGLAVAGRKLEVPRTERIERAIVGAIFPPALLRFPAELVFERLAVFHPVTLAVALLPRSHARRVLRAAIGKAARLAARDASFGAQVRAGLEQLAVEIDLEPALVRPRALAEDEHAPSFCPICLDEYRPGFRWCRDCGVATVALPHAGSGSP